MRSGRRLLWLLPLGLGLWSISEAPANDQELGTIGILGPFAELAADVQWLRFHSASLHGQEGRALELAESALALDPASNEGWQTLAAHLVFDLASRQREPDLARRRLWFRAGLSVLARGVERAERPGELELFRALALLSKAEGDPELDPLGAPALSAAAAAALERAAALGEKHARDLLGQAPEAE